MAGIIEKRPEVPEGTERPVRLMDYVTVLENRGSRSRGDMVLEALVEMGISPSVQSRRRPRLRNIIVDFPSRSSAKRLLFSEFCLWALCDKSRRAR